MLKNKRNINDIVEDTELSIGEIKQIQEEMEKEQQQEQ